MRKAKLVEGVRGPGGGYRLSRPADEINIAQIISAVDEKVDVTRCNKEGNCQDGVRCLTHDLWVELSERLYDFLEGISLAQFANRPGIHELAIQRDKINGRFILARRQAEVLQQEKLQQQRKVS